MFCHLPLSGGAAANGYMEALFHSTLVMLLRSRLHKTLCSQVASRKLTLGLFTWQPRTGTVLKVAKEETMDHVSGHVLGHVLGHANRTAPNVCDGKYFFEDIFG